jgi:hypothetical protein
MSFLPKKRKKRPRKPPEEKLKVRVVYHPPKVPAEFPPKEAPQAKPPAEEVPKENFKVAKRVLEKHREAPFKVKGPSFKTILFEILPILIMVVMAAYYAFLLFFPAPGPIPSAKSLSFRFIQPETSYDFIFYAKDIGSSGMKLRIEGTLEGQNVTIIVNGALHQAWIRSAGRWLDVGFDSFWNQWNTWIKDYQRSLSGWTSGTWTSSDGKTIITNIQVNPVLDDSLFLSGIAPTLTRTLIPTLIEKTTTITRITTPTLTGTTTTLTETPITLTGTLTEEWKGTFHVLTTSKIFIEQVMKGKGVAGSWVEFGSGEIVGSIELTMWHEGSKVWGWVSFTDVQTSITFDNTVFGEYILTFTPGGYQFEGTVNANGSLTFTEFGWPYVPFTAKIEGDVMSANFDTTFVPESPSLICLKEPRADVMGHTETKDSVTLNLRKISGSLP